MKTSKKIINFGALLATLIFTGCNNNVSDQEEPLTQEKMREVLSTKECDIFDKRESEMMMCRNVAPEDQVTLGNIVDGSRVDGHYFAWLLEKSIYIPDPIPADQIEGVYMGRPLAPMDHYLERANDETIVSCRMDENDSFMNINMDKYNCLSEKLQ